MGSNPIKSSRKNNGIDQNVSHRIGSNPVRYHPQTDPLTRKTNSNQ